MVQQVNEKDREIHKLKGQLAKGNYVEGYIAMVEARDQEIVKLNRECDVRKVTAGLRNQEIEDMKGVRIKEKAELDDTIWENEKLKDELAQKQGGPAGDPNFRSLVLELQKTQASFMALAAPPSKTGDRGVEMGTQTDDDGSAEKLAVLKRMFG